MSTKAKRHTHKYHRMEINGNKQWKCALPDCSHVMPRHLTNTILGKYSICWQCGANDMILDEINMQMDMPICLDCQNGTVKEKEKITVPTDFDINDLLGKKD